MLGYIVLRRVHQLPATGSVLKLSTLHGSESNLLHPRCRQRYTRSQRQKDVSCFRVRSNNVSRELSGLCQHSTLASLQCLSGPNRNKKRLLCPNGNMIIDKQTKSGYRKWNKDMIDTQTRLVLDSLNVTVKSSRGDIETALRSVQETIHDFYVTKKQDKTVHTNRLRMLLYPNKDIEYEGFDSFTRIQTAWEKLGKKKHKKFFIPVGSSYHDKCERLQVKLHSTMDEKYPHLNLWDWKNVWDIMIIENDDTKQASALPNGSFIVSANLIDDLSEDELAFLLAHEMAHVYLKHHNEVKSITDFLEGFAWTVMIKTAMLSPHYWNDTDKVRIVQEFFKKMTQRFPDEYEMENEADAVAYWLIKQAGIDPKAGLEFRERYRKNPELLPLHEFDEIETYDTSTMMTDINPHIPSSNSTTAPQWMTDFMRNPPIWRVRQPTPEQRVEYLTAIHEGRPPPSYKKEDRGDHEDKLATY